MKERYPQIADVLELIELTEKTKQLCLGCYNEDYHHGLGGAKECWSFKDAKVCKRKEVHINDRPPWKNQKVFTTLDCYRKPKFVYVEPEREY